MIHPNFDWAVFSTVTGQEVAIGVRYATPFVALSTASAVEGEYTTMFEARPMNAPTVTGEFRTRRIK